MSDADSITRALGGRWFGGASGYGVAFCPAHDNRRTPALTLANGREGRLLASCKAGCDFGDVLDALRGRGLVSGEGRAFEPDPAAEAQRAALERADRARRLRQAEQAWAEAGPAEGTLAEAYLRARAIRSPIPATLRFAPQAWHGAPARRLPAMVAAVALGEAFVGVHRTYLAEPGRKASVDPQRAMLGPIRGGAVRLAEGVGPLVVAEGIETALSLRDALADLRPSIWAGLSTSGVASLRLPREPGELVLAPDGDDAGRTAAARLARAAVSYGWRVRVMDPPGPGLDWNDAAQEAAR